MLRMISRVKQSILPKKKTERREKSHRRELSKKTPKGFKRLKPKTLKKIVKLEA